MGLVNFLRGHALKFACVASIALLTLFGVQMIASASEEGGNATCEQLPAIEEMFRLGLTPSLNMTDGDGLTTSLSMTDGDGLATSDGVTGSAEDDSALCATTSRITMYRLYNKYTGEHFYTSNATEKNNLVKASWTYEGVGWYAPKTSKTPVYRLYNPYVSGGDHHYTTNSSERSTLKNAGWKDEGVGWYSTDAGEIDRVPLYRQYNPFAQTGTHNYTQSKSENDKLIKAGWKAEGTGWYGYSKSTPTIQALDFSKISVSTTAKTYNGKAQTQTIKSSAYKRNTDYTVTYSNNKNAGTATIVVKGKGNYTGTKTYKFTINKLNISSATVTLNGTGQFIYDKTVHEQKVSKVVANGITLSSSDYAVSNNKQTNAGTYNLTVTGRGNCTGSLTKAFTVAKATPVCNAPAGMSGKLGDTLLTVDLNTSSVSGNTPGKFAWSEPFKEMNETGNKEYSATFIPTDTANYTTATDINISVQVVEPSYDGGFWLGSKNAGNEYVNEAYFAKQDPNYISGAEISAEMKVLHDNTDSNYTTVKTKWDKYYSDDEVRLYATYAGGENETAFDGTSKNTLNKYVEFRILEVSPTVDGHDGDQSAVTFMATHLLPTAYQMNETEDINDGGWNSTDLVTKMNSGEIYNKFASDFITNVRKITKTYGTGNATSNTSSGSYIFWILSNSELAGSSAPISEGSQYAWCLKNKILYSNSSNSVLNSWKTRAGATPGSASSAYEGWWTRSPFSGSLVTFSFVFMDGCINSNNFQATSAWGVAPAFCF